MPSLIELQDVENCRGPLTIRVGDVLMIPGSGGRIETGSSIELGGPYLPATAVASGEVLRAVGTPHTMLAWARRPGLAILEVVSGDLGHQTQKATLRVKVEK